jgi:hypothetical protein
MKRMNTTLGKIGRVLGLAISYVIGLSVLMFWDTLIPPLQELPWFGLVWAFLGFTISITAFSTISGVFGCVLAQIGGYFMLTAAFYAEKDPQLVVFWLAVLLFLLYLSNERGKSRYTPVLRGLGIMIFQGILGILIFISHNYVSLWLNPLVFGILVSFYSDNSRVKLKAFLRHLFIYRDS